MKKTNQNFRMSRSSKIALANEINPQKRAIIKKLLIDAQLIAEAPAPKKD